MRFADFFKANIKLYLITRQYFCTDLRDVEDVENRQHGRPNEEQHVDASASNTVPHDVRVQDESVQEPPAKQMRVEKPMESLLIPMEDLAIGAVIGKGGMGEVYRGEWRNKAVAIKKCFAPSAKAAHTMAPAVEREANVMSSLSHVNVVSFYGYARQGRDFYIVTELMDGSLDGMLYAQEGCILTRDEKVFICKEILR